jgi:hypothetical protein
MRSAGYAVLFVFGFFTLASDARWTLIIDKEATLLDPSNYYIKNFISSNVRVVIATYAEANSKFPNNLFEFAKVNKFRPQGIESSCAVGELVSAKSGVFIVKLTKHKMIISKSDNLFKYMMGVLKNPSYSLEFGQTVTATCIGRLENQINLTESKLVLSEKSKISFDGEDFIINMKLKGGFVATSLR